MSQDPRQLCVNTYKALSAGAGQWCSLPLPAADVLHFASVAKDVNSISLRVANFLRLGYKIVMRTWTQLIEAWGGSGKFAKDLGIPRGTAAAMMHRNAVHSRYWPDIVARARYAGLEGITFELLVSLQTGHVTEGKPREKRFPRSKGQQIAVA